MFSSKTLIAGICVLLLVGASALYAVNTFSSGRTEKQSSPPTGTVEPPPPPAPASVAPTSADPPADTLETVIETIAGCWNTTLSLRAAVQTYSATTWESATGMGTVQHGEGTYECRKQNGAELFRVELTIQNAVTGGVGPDPSGTRSQSTSPMRMLKVSDGNTVYQEMSSLDMQTMPEKTVATAPTVIKGNSGDFASFLSPGGLGEHPLALLKKYGMSLQLNPETTVNGRAAYVLEAAPPGIPPADAPVARMIFYFDRETGSVLRVEYLSSQNVLTAYTELRDIEVNPEMAGDRFNYAPPASVEVRELGDLSGLTSETQREQTPPPLPNPPERRKRDLRVR